MILITLDVDWAPDDVISSVAEILLKNKIKSTWFITHQTPLLHFFRENDNYFELGIHPNFLRVQLRVKMMKIF